MTWGVAGTTFVVGTVFAYLVIALDSDALFALAVILATVAVFAALVPSKVRR